MNNKKYLDEAENQRISNKLNKIGKVLLIIGGIGFLTCSVLIFGFEVPQIGILWIAFFGVIVAGLIMLFVGNQRKISAYMTQQQIPVAKEAIDEMAPTVGSAAGEIAKGVVKGINEAKEDEIYCKHCGSKIDSDSTFCNKCGKEQ